MKVAFLDRDGTINRDYPDAEWARVTVPELLPGALAAMRGFRARGYEIVIVTNQYTIGEGIILLADYRRFTERLLTVCRQGGVEILDIFFCPHARDARCDCCKPRPGLIRQACEKYPEIDLAASFFAGDSPADRELARSCGLQFYGVGPEGARGVVGLMDILAKLDETKENFT